MLGRGVGFGRRVESPTNLRHPYSPAHADPRLRPRDGMPPNRKALDEYLLGLDLQ
jgi:hypothetical protein